jgi:Flp pilus assembly protein TadG
MKRSNRKRDRKYERGQILILLAFVMIGLMLCSALAIDVGFAYVTKARLGKAVDAACLLGMANLAQGQGTATTIATNTFSANYPVTGLDANAPTVNVNFSQNSGQQVVGVSATATIRTIFMGLLPGYRTLNVSASAQALRGFLAMTVVLDRSGSMAGNGGQAALQSAAPTFVNYFNNITDQVGMVSFASNATIDFTIANHFLDAGTGIPTKIAGLTFTGATFGPGGLTLAKAQEDSVVPQQGQNLVKVVVYFTDGLVNTIQTTLSCNGTPTLYNIGGYDINNDPNVGFFVPATGVQTYRYDGSSRWYTCDGSGNCNTQTSTSCLRNDAGFTSAIDGSTKSFTRAHVTADAQYQALQTATAMRAENPGVYIYSIGLGSSPSTTFLQQIANDPASPTYDPTKPIGMAVFAPDCPSTQCTTELTQVFQTIAAKILLRLIQ